MEEIFLLCSFSASNTVAWSKIVVLNSISLNLSRVLTWLSNVQDSSSALSETVAYLVSMGLVSSSLPCSSEVIFNLRSCAFHQSFQCGDTDKVVA